MLFHQFELPPWGLMALLLVPCSLIPPITEGKGKDVGIVTDTVIAKETRGRGWIPGLSETNPAVLGTQELPFVQGDSSPLILLVPE